MPIIAFVLRKAGDEPARAMTLALGRCRALSRANIDYVNLHGTSTMLNDRIETNALKLSLNGQRSSLRRCPQRNRRLVIRRARAVLLVWAQLCARCKRE